MKDRIEKIVGTEARSLWMGTFHSIFARILRSEGYKLGYPPNFVIYDTQDSKSLIKSIVKELNLDPKIYKENFVYNRISNAKNRLISYIDYANNPILQEEDASALRPRISEIYKIYVNRCFKSHAMDFDDLLFKIIENEDDYNPKKNSKKILSLPIGEHLSHFQIKKISRLINKFYNN